MHFSRGSMSANPHRLHQQQPRIISREYFMNTYLNVIELATLAYAIFAALICMALNIPLTGILQVTGLLAIIISFALFIYRTCGSW